MRSSPARIPGWRNTPAPVRGQLLYRVQRRMEERKQELAEALTREEGKTLGEARGEVQRAINVIEFFAGRRAGSPARRSRRSCRTTSATR